MSAQHIDEDLLDQYASGSIHRESVAALEEHLLICADCQTRLIAADEFVGLFRAAAMQADARPQPLSWRLFGARVLTWAGAASLMAAALFLVSVELRESPVPATVLMHALRGPEAATVIAAGKPVRLVFDLRPTAIAQDYEAQIVNLLGAEVELTPMEITAGNLSIAIKKLDSGSYWLRIYRGTNRDLVAEYGLRAK